MEGAIDKKFQDQYNYLTQLLSAQMKRGVLSSVDGHSVLNLNAGTFHLRDKLVYDGENITIDGKVTIRGGSGYANLEDKPDLSVYAESEGLGSLAYDDAVGLAKLDDTIITGGYIKTTLLNASNIKTGSLVVGGIGTEGISNILVKDSLGNTKVTIDDTGINVDGTIGARGFTDYFASDLSDVSLSIFGTGFVASVEKEGDTIDIFSGSWSTGGISSKQVFWSAGGETLNVGVGGSNIFSSYSYHPTFGVGSTLTDYDGCVKIDDRLQLPHRTNPSSFENGDLWTTTTSLLGRINGTTRTFYHTGNLPIVSQSEAEAGTSTTPRAWTAQRVRQAIIAYVG